MFRFACLALGLVGILVLSPAAMAVVIVYETHMNGGFEAPPNGSPGTGWASAIYDSTAHTLQLQANFQGLQGNTTAAHIHAPTAVPFQGTVGVATTTPSFVGFPLGVTSGTFANTLDLTLASSWNPSYVTANGGTTAGAEAAFTAALAQGRAYFNVHSQTVPGGEIRGFLFTPEPTSLIGLLFGALMMRRRR